MMLLFGATVFLGAGLLFLVQPMVAKMVLPMYGGSPQVWNTSMLFFQTVLLAGYAATHLIASHSSPRRHAWLQVVLLLVPLIALPIDPPLVRGSADRRRRAGPVAAHGPRRGGRSAVLRDRR